MAHLNDVFVDVSNPNMPEDLRNYELSSDSRCSCCPYGFHVDNSFVNFTDTMKRGKHLRYNTIHGDRSLHLQSNIPPDLGPQGESSSFRGIDNDRDDFALFGTRTERRKKKQSKKEKPASQFNPNEFLDLSGAGESANFTSFEGLKGEHLGTGSARRSNEFVHQMHLSSTDSSVCKQCPGCIADDVATYTCPHHTMCCHNSTSYADCCSDTCYHDECHNCHEYPHLNIPEPEVSPKIEPVQISNVDAPPFPIEEQVETIKIEFDPEKVNEIRQYLMKCVSRIHELESQLRSMPVLQVRNSALREENSLLQDRVTNQKMIIEQLSRDFKKFKQKEELPKIYNASSQTDSSKSTNNIQGQSVSIQTMPEPQEIEEGITESRMRRDLASPISRRRFPSREEPVRIPPTESFPKPDTIDAGVGDHDVSEFYTLDPNGWKQTDIPESFYKGLKASWIAALPKPRVASTGVSNTPDLRHKLIDAREEMKNALVGDHDVHTMYFIQPELMSVRDLPQVAVQQLRDSFEADYKPKVTLSSIGVNAVQATRSQLVETETLTDSIGVGNHDISSLYFIQPNLQSTEELPSEMVKQLYESWESRLPAKPQTATLGMQWDLETCEQALETDRPSLSSIGVGEHDVSRFYLLEYQPYDCEGELPTEILVYLKEKWHKEWEQSLPSKPSLLSTSTVYTKSSSNKVASTDTLIRKCSVGIGDHDVSKVYFVQPDIPSIENELPSHYIQKLGDMLKQSWLQTLPPKPELVNRVVEYRRLCLDKSSSTEKQIRRNYGVGDHGVDKVYFLDSENANEQDLPHNFIRKLNDTWTNIQNQQKPVKPRLISRAVLCKPIEPIRLDIGTMSEDPQPAMFDESVDVDLDNEEWAALDERTWSDGHPSSIVRGTTLKSVIEELRHKYRYQKPEFVSFLSKMFARQVRTKSIQVSPQLAENCTVYGDLSSSLITRGVGEDTVDSQLVPSVETAAAGVQHKPLSANKLSSTVTPIPINRSTSTERKLHEQSVTYNRPTKITNRSINTDKTQTRSVVVWADLERTEEDPDSDEDRFIKETWEELCIYDSQGNIIRTERLPTYTVSQYPKEKPQISESLPTREEGGRYEHYYVNVGDSRGSSIAGDHSLGGSSGANLPSFSGPHDIPGTKTRDVTSKPSMDFVPRSPTESHPHIHVCGTDPAANKVHDWEIKDSSLPDWQSTGDMETDSIRSTTGSAHESLDGKQRLSDRGVADPVNRSDIHSSYRSDPGNTSQTLASSNRPRPDNDHTSRPPPPYPNSRGNSDSRSPLQSSSKINRGYENTKTNSQTQRPSADGHSQITNPPSDHSHSLQRGGDGRSNSSNPQFQQIPSDRLREGNDNRHIPSSRNIPQQPGIISNRRPDRQTSESPSTSSNTPTGTRQPQNITERPGFNAEGSHLDNAGNTNQNIPGNRSSGSTTHGVHQQSGNTNLTPMSGNPAIGMEDNRFSSMDKSQNIPDSQSSGRNVQGFRETSLTTKQQHNQHDHRLRQSSDAFENMNDNRPTGGFDIPVSASFKGEQTGNQNLRANATNIPVNVPVMANNPELIAGHGNRDSGNASNISSQSKVSDSSSKLGFPNVNKGRFSVDSTPGDQAYPNQSIEFDLNSSLNRHPGQSSVTHHTVSQKSSRVVSGKTVVTAPSGINPTGIEVIPPALMESDELRPLFNSTWSASDNAGSQTHTTSSITKTTSNVVAKDGQIVERSSTTDRHTTDNASLASQATVPQTSQEVEMTQRQSFESDDDSVFLRPSPPGSGLHQSARRAHARHKSGPTVSQDDECLDYGGGISENQSLSTPSSPRLPRSIMKRNVNVDSEKQYSTLPLLRKKKGIRFSKDTKSDSVSSSSFSGEEEIVEEEPPYELEFMRRLERLRDERCIPNRKVLERANLTPKMRECFQKIVDWMLEPSKFNNKQMNEAISSLRREWFVSSAGREAESVRVKHILDTMQQFSPALLEIIVNLADDNGNTSLHYAVSGGQWSIVAQLLDTNRVRISRTNKAGYTPLMLSALCRKVHDAHRPVIQRLLASGNINQGSSLAGQTALMLAASHGRTDMIHLLLESGADPNRRDKEGSTALMCASEHGHLDAVKMLLTSSHCDFNLKDNDGSTALSIALENKHRDVALLIYSRSNLKDSTGHKRLQRHLKSIRNRWDNPRTLNICKDLDQRDTFILLWVLSQHEKRLSKMKYLCKKHKSSMKKS